MCAFLHAYMDVCVSACVCMSTCEVIGLSGLCTCMYVCVCVCARTYENN